MVGCVYCATNVVVGLGRRLLPMIVLDLRAYVMLLCKESLNNGYTH